MKRINQDELYQHLNDFLRSKGVEFKEGSYTRKIQKGCALLSDAVNLGQKGIVRARAEIDKKLDQMRQVIHEKTAPKPSANSPTPEQPLSESGDHSQPIVTKKPLVRSKPRARKTRPGRK